jgi:XTP/dITP diphosphohydrolase
MELVVATRSADKLAEIRRILADVPGLRLLDLNEAGVAWDPAEESLEPHDTFEENALSKALYFHGKTGRPTVADDSGLEVEALSGAPGVRSKRFAPVELPGKEMDEANNRHLLECLEDLPPTERIARYVCVAVLVDGDSPPVVCRGEVPGRILDEPQGTGGFGYDPLFFDPGLGHTFAQISREEKNERSHRGRAFRLLADRLGER